MKRVELEKERNNTLKEIKLLLKEEQDAILDLELRDIIHYKDDSNKCYQAVRKVYSHKPKKQLAICDENFKLVSSEEEQIIIITDYFKNCSLPMNFLKRVHQKK